MTSSIARLRRMQCIHSLSSFASSSSTRAMLYLPIHRHAMMSTLSRDSEPTVAPLSNKSLGQTPPVVVPTHQAQPSAKSLSPDASSPQTAARPPAAPRPERRKPAIKSTKAAITLTTPAVERLRALLRGPAPQLIRIGVRNKGCAGLSYHLEYVDRPGKFDEVVEQDGVKVAIDSKALFSIIGSEMDWREDALSAKFAFNNPNIKDACGCGESFSVGS